MAECGIEILSISVRIDLHLGFMSIFITVTHHGKYILDIAHIHQPNTGICQPYFSIETVNRKPICRLKGTDPVTLLFLLIESISLHIHYLNISLPKYTQQNITTTNISQYFIN